MKKSENYPENLFRDIDKRNYTEMNDSNLNELIEKLSSFEREVFDLRYRRKLSYKEMSDILDCTQKAVENALMRIKRKFRFESSIKLLMNK